MAFHSPHRTFVCVSNGYDHMTCLILFDRVLSKGYDEVRLLYPRSTLTCHARRRLSVCPV